MMNCQYKCDTFSFKTLYRWIYDGMMLLGDLRPKGKRRKPRGICGRFYIEMSIYQHSKEVKNRETFGHGK